VLIYGWLAAAWRVIVVLTILVAAAVLFEGAGIILACAAGTLLLWGALRFGWQTVQEEWSRQPGRCLAGLGKGLGCGLLLMAVMQLPWPGGVSAPGIVEFRGLVSLRSEAPGFITAIAADSGQGVPTGRLVVQLENPELQLEASRLELSIQQSESRRKGFLQRGEIGAAQVEARHQQALQEQLQQHLQELASLELEVPHADGVVVTRRLQDRLETYIPWGQEIVAIGHPGRKDFEVLLDQTGWELARQQLGQPCSLYLPGVGRLEGRIAKVDPRATLRPQQRALTAAAGGPLPIRTSDSEEAPVLAEPRFQVTVELSAADSLRVAAGQRGVLLLGGGTRTWASVAYHSFTNWIRAKYRAARSQNHLVEASSPCN
jgi:putative peptide zinc metalloprotease protein